MSRPDAVGSPHNPRLRAIRALRSGRDRENVLLEGRRVLGEALDCRIHLTCVLIAEEAFSARYELAALAARAEAAGAEVRLCSDALLRAVGDLDSPADAIGWAPRPVCTHETLIETLVAGAWWMVAAGVQEPGNVGALARVAAALGAAAFVTGAGGASPWHPRALRGASGTSLRLPVHERADLLALLGAARARGAVCWAADAAGADARPLAAAWRARGAPPALLLLGEEGRGVPDELAAACDARVAIPLARGVESLNVATAGAVLAWELFARERPS